MSRIRNCGAYLAAALTTTVVTSPSLATWSIVIADSETKEVAVGTVTCLDNFDLLAIVPVIVVGKGGAAVQAAGDFAGIRRPVIFEHFMLGTDPEEILVLLADISGHQSRQYGISDTQSRMITFTGSSTSQWAGGVIGTQGSMVYAIQGNILAGGCVVPAIEEAVLNTDGDVAAKLMAGMQAARSAGCDGRCSCSPATPEGCGCPPLRFNKSGHIGTMVVARIGDTEDDVCNANGCADGDYFMKFNVPFQTNRDPDPVFQLQAMFDDWRAALVGRPDAIQSVVVFDPDPIPPDGKSMTTVEVTLLDWQGKLITQPIDSFTVTHAPESAGLSTIGKPMDNGDGTFSVPITAGGSAGIDRFLVELDDGIRPVTLMPNPTLQYFTVGDINMDGYVSAVDVLLLLGSWGRCDDCDDCPADLNGDCIVGAGDLLILLGNWS